jgi:cytochrome c peroxidase
MRIWLRGAMVLTVVLMLAGCPTEPPGGTGGPGTGTGTATGTGGATGVASGTAVEALPALPPAPPIPTVPLGNEAPPAPDKNPMTAEKVELGHNLWFDTRLSGDGTMSCATCHPAEGWLADGKAISVGVGGKPAKRHTPSMLNKAHDPLLYWDGRADKGLEGQALAPIKGFLAADVAKVVAALQAVPGYRALFKAAYGDETVTDERIAFAIASYERTLLSGNSPWDRWQKNGDTGAVSEDAKKGWELFRGKAACGSCHAGFGLTDGKFHNTGIGMDKVGTPAYDGGRADITKSPDGTRVAADEGAFKTPSLRDVARTSPYFHDGSVETLTDAVRLMAGGGKANPNLDKELKDHKLTDAEVKQLVAFLASLNSDVKLPAAPDLPK